MLQSQLFAKTKKEIPQEIESISHKLLYKGDFIDQLGSGIYSFLPLGLRVQQKIIGIIRQEMAELGAQEVLLPSLHPKKVWEQSGRWATINPPLFKIKDGHRKEFALGSTHEEVMTKIVKERVASYKDLPVMLFQFQTKFRNEMRYTGGLLRTREFIMKDLYSFHQNEQGFQEFYEKVAKSYLRIFQRCGLNAKRVKASGLGFTSSFTDEFQVLTPVGEDTVLYCDNCSFAQNKEIAKLKAGDKCPECGKYLKKERGIEVGNIFPLGTKYAKSFGLYFLDREGNKRLPIMGSYGIGVGRLMAAIVEVNHDQKGIIWPESVAPFDVHILALGIQEEEKEKALGLYQELRQSGLEVLYDDRDGVASGQKLIEADIIGCPLRIVVSPKTLKKQEVEIKQRKSKKIEMAQIKDAAEKIKVYLSKFST